MAQSKRQELIARLHGALPRYHRSDDKDTDTTLSTADVALAVEYLTGEK